jgi:hypothetical protein
MSRDTTVDERLAAIDAAFEEPPRAQLPATVQQIVMDERPQGAISVNVKRDEKEIFRKIKVIATAAGDDFFYSWNTKNKDGTKGVVEGPSVKCANAVARLFGNCSVKVRVFDQGPHWILYAQFYDFETGFVLERPFQQRKNQKTGMGDADRQLDIVFQIGTSKAARNVVCNALSEFTDFAFAVAKEQLVEKIGKRLDHYRAQVLERLTALKVDPHRVELVRGKPFDKWIAADIAKIIAEIQSVNDGMIHPDDAWPPLAEGGGSQAGAPKPQPEDFQPAADGPATAKTAGQAAAAAAGPDAGAAAAADAPKPEGQPAASPGAQAAVSEKPAETQAAAESGNGSQQSDSARQAAQEPAQAAQGEAQGESQTGPAAGTGPDPEGPTAAEQALEQAEAVLKRGTDNLQALRTPEDIDSQAPSITAILSEEFPDLDPEDRALLLNRWKSAQLERKRDMGRKGKGRR